MLTALICLVLLIICFSLLTQQASAAVWLISYTLFALLLLRYVALGLLMKSVLGLVFLLGLVFALKPCRQFLLSRYLLRVVSKVVPRLSATEREALEAGTVSWEGNLLSGAPDFHALLQAPVVALTAEEQAFIDGPVNELCRLIDDWEITHVHTDMPASMWQFIKDNRFFGMIIPKQYGGLEFSATAQVFILARLYGRSVTVATTVSVPNALGPAELLLKYGTPSQKEFYLPRLADGREVPCFALTSPNAGSDAASIPDKGIVCKQQVNGQEIIGLRLTWSKRYITLCPVATVIGLAFRLFDPDNLLGKGTDVGISCALIPANTPGVITGRRHFPLNTGFLNGPTEGNNVFVPLDCLIGGVEMAGAGWRMLMECLSVGRAVSLPSSAAGGMQAATLATGAYARVRKQFGQAIANFDGVAEVLARMAANTYIVDSSLTMTAAAIDQGAKPAVAGAILKYHATEKARQVALDAMDIHGGKGICLGPNNYLGRGYQNSTIAITVEGANILTRNLIIFGQGAVRCHPYVFRQLESVRQQDVQAFDMAFWGHISLTLANICKSILFVITDARFTAVPKSSMRRYYQLIHRYSTQLSLLTDLSLFLIGGKLKRKEMISARLGDVLSYLYLMSAVLKRFHADGESEADKPLVEWSCQQLLYESELAIQGIIVNFSIRWARPFLKLVLRPFGNQRLKPADRLTKKIAQLLTEPNATRTRLTRYVFAEPIKTCPLGRLEAGFHKLVAVALIEKKVAQAVKQELLTSLTLLEQIEEAKQQGILTEEEAMQLSEAEQARQMIIAVDDFADEELRRNDIYP